MDFISNLLKRPISLVLNDSSSSMDQQQQQPHHSRSAPGSPSASQRATVVPPPPHSNSLIVTAMNTSINEHMLESVGSSVEDSSFSSSCTSLLQPLQSVVTHNTQTSNAIGELLLQINDSLNQASLDDIDATSSIEQHHHRGNITLVELSPLGAKAAAATKLTLSPRPATQQQVATLTPTIASPSPILSAVPGAAATSAVFEINSSLNQFHIDPELEADLFEADQLGLHDNNSCTGVNKSSNKFVGLTEFDEANIPELPGSLNPDIEAQLKLTFEEGLIPTLTANSIVESDIKLNNLFVHHETDTAFSSDNETFAECQSYQDLAYDPPTDLSIGETYRSALNSKNTSAANITMEDPLNATMENVPELQEAEFQQDLQNVTFDDEPMDVDVSLTENTDEAVNLTPKANAKMEIPEIANVSEHLNEFEHVEVEQYVDKEHADQNISKIINNPLGDQAELKPVAHNEEQQHANIDNAMQQSNNHTQSTVNFEQKLNEVLSNSLENQIIPKRLTFTLLANENISNVVQPVAPQFDMQQSTHELDLSKSIELPTNLPKSAINECVILNNTNDIEATTSATTVEEQQDAADVHQNVANVQQDVTATLLTTVTNDKTPTEVKEISCSDEITVTTESSTIADLKLNLTMDMNSSMGSSKSSTPSSPTFPIKQTSDVRQFPRNPATDTEREMHFLEKSDYAARMEATASQQCPVASVNIIPPSPPKLQATNLNETVNISLAQRESSASPAPIAAVLNGTFPCSSAADSPAADADSSHESVNKRRTFNITPEPQEIASPTEGENEVIANITNTSVTEKRRTFTLPSPTQSTELNETFESMDVDVTIPPNSPTLKAPAPEHFKADEAASKLPSPSHSPPVPALQQRQNAETAFKIPAHLPPKRSPPPIPTLQARSSDEFAFKIPPAPPVLSPPVPALLKRPPIHEFDAASSVIEPLLSPEAVAVEMLSAKEQTKSQSKDEKDIFVEKFVPSSLEEILASPSLATTFVGFGSGATAGGNDPEMEQFSDNDFQGNNCNSNVKIDRSSLLLRFDPLLGVPVAVHQPQQQLLQLQQLLGNSNFGQLSPTREEDDDETQNQNQYNRLFAIDSASRSTGANSASAAGAETEKASSAAAAAEVSAKLKSTPAPTLAQDIQPQTQAAKPKKHVSMSVDVIKDINIDNDCKKSFENSNLQSDEKQSNFKMDDLEKKIKNEVLKTEDIEKKLKEAEQREEALIKRITEKDKTISKMNGVIEAYEKAIAELIAEKEQLIQNYEKQLAEVKSDRDSNYHHLTSLETTFSDLHVKYEKSKEMTSQLKASEESLLAEKRQNLENLRLQEQRYEKMKNHAMQQLEIANKKLESLTKEHAIESTKLKALLKKEEISRASINEQLQQKSRENAELVKICDELINGQGS